MRQEQDIVTPQKGMNLDSDPKAVSSKDGEYLYGSAFHMWAKGIPTYMKGNTEVSWNQPAGVNKCIGTFWHHPSNTQFQWHWNSLGNHTIARYYPKSGTSPRRIDIIAQGSEFNLLPDKKISGANMLDDEWLKWVDSGNNAPRQISVKLADNNGKKNKINVYFPYDPNEVDQRVFGATILLGNTTVTANTNFYTATSSEVFYFPEMLVAWANAFNATFPQFTATACNDHVELEATSTGEWSVVPRLTDTVLGVVQPQVVMRLEYSNRYNAPWDYRQIDAARFMPVVPPTVSVISDPKRKTNECSGHVFQFSYYYITVDRHTSPAGPWSPVVYPQQVCSGAYNGNTILLDLNADLNLTQAAGLGEIDRIHLMVSIDGGPFVLGGDYPKSDWIYTRQIKWANDGIYPAIDPTQSSETENSAPIIAYAQEQFSNPTEPDNIRVAYGGIKEGHPTPCIPVKLRVRVDEGDLSGSGTVDIEVWVRVCNMYSTASVVQFWTAQPIWRRQLNGPSRIGGFGLTDTDNDDCDQITASGGIPVYIAGQRYVAVTEQVVTNIAATSTNYIGGTTVLDGSQLGFNVNPSNLTGRSGIRYCITTGDIYQRAVIKSVPTGQSVVLRVADTRCAFLNNGSLLDLNNPLLAYQTTSTNIFGSQPGPSSASFPLNSREIVVDIPANASGTIFAGTFLYMDCTTPDVGSVNSCTFKGYIFDDNGDDYVAPGPGANDIRVDGTSMDRTWVGVFPFDAGNNAIIITPNAPGAQYWAALGVTAAGSICLGFNNCTDHNGYYFLPFRKNLLAAGWRMASVSITGDPSNPVGFFGGYTSLGINVINLTLLNDFGDNKWIGTLTTGTLTGPDTNNLDTSGRFMDYIMANVNPDARDRIRTHVEGRVTDTSGLGLANASVVLGNGKWIQTQTDGYFSIIAYGSMNNGWSIGSNFNNRIEDSLYYGWTGGCITTFVNGNVQGPVQITQYWDGREYSEQVAITVLDKEYDFTPANSGAVIGRGTTFPVVLKLYDQHGRQTPVQFLQLVRIPGLTEDLHDFDPIQYPVGTYRFGNAHIDFEILGDVPVAEDVRYIQAQFARGADQRASYRFEWLSTYTTYVVRYDNATDQRVTTTYSSGTATEIWFNIGDGMQRYRDENADASKVDANGDVVAFGQIGYTFTPGDRVQILTDSNGTFLTPLRDYAIRGSIGGSIIIANEPGLPPFTGGEHLRIYTPGATTESELLPYLELPLDTQAIIDPFGTPQWSMPTGELHGGDTYRIPTRVPIRPGFIGTTLDPTASVPWSSRIVVRESPSALDSIVNVVPSLGRSWFIDPQSKYELRGTLIRVSDVWLPGTGTNGSCRFRAGNSGTGNPVCGTIISMNELNGVVGCLCSIKSFAFYPGQTVSQTGDGVFISQGKQILGWIRDYAVEAGTTDPSSVVVERTSAGSWVKFWDARRSQVVRLSVNGFDPMEYKLGQEFNRIEKSYQGKDYTVVAGANTIHKEYWITFEPKSVVVNNIDVDAGARTLVFYEPTNSWICEYPVQPEMYGRTENEQQTILGSRVWVQDDNDIRGSFNGTKFPFRCKVVLNSDPIVVSAYKALWVTPASAWEAPLITNLRGQESSIDAALFEEWEGVSKSAINCDVHSPVPDPLFNGADMRDSIIIIELVNRSDDEVTLFAVDVRKVPSKATLR